MEEFISKGLSTRKIGKIVGKSSTTIRYWIEKHGLEIKASIKVRQYKCSCGETDPSKFYGIKKCVCATCHNKHVRARGIQKREYALNKLGNECINCGFKTYSCSLDIHHLDPSIKDEKFHGMRGWSLSRIDNEIKNCVILCRNCHSAYHSGYITI